MKKIVSTLIAFTLALLSFAILSLAAVAPASADVPTKITYCQADNGTNSWKPIPAAHDSVITKDGELKQGGVNANDIIPSFEYDFGGDNAGTFEGFNWTPANQVFYANGCAAALNVLTPPVPTFAPATCADLDGELLHNNTDPRITVSLGNLDGKTLTVAYDKISNETYNSYEWVAGAVLSYTFEVLDPTTDPLWDSAKGVCRMPDTGAGDIKSEHILYAGILIFAGLTMTTLVRRRKS